MEYKKVKLKEVATILNGRAYKQNELLYNGKYKVLRVGNFFTSDTWYYSDFELEENKYCNNGDLLFAWSANFGPKIWDGDKTIYHYHIWKFELTDKVDKYYLYYYLRFITELLKKNTHGSVMMHLTKFEMENLELRLPNINIQKKIGYILNKLDKKIELNNHINNNLLEIGTELLKNDFILENEKENLSQVIKFVKGKKPNYISTNKQVGYEKYLTIACLNGQELNYADTNNMVMSNNDLLMVMDGASSGEVYYGGQGIVGSTLSRIDCIDNNYISEFIFFSLKYYKNLIQSKNTGSAIPHTDKVFVGSLEIPKINIEKQEKYNVLLSKIQHNQNENKTLENLRDTLLPKLINGKIDLDKIKI